MKIFAIVVLSILALGLLVLALYLLIGLGAYKLALSRHSLVKKKLEKVMNADIDRYKIDRSWWDKYPFEDVEILSEEGYRLRGHFLNRGDKLAILVHGYGGEYKEMNGYAKIFVDRGYSVLAVECRAHGASEGNMIGMGWYDRLDLVKWIEKMLTINPDFKIVLMGISMGAATVCMTLGEKLPSNVVCAISDCAYDNVYREFSYIFKHHTHQPGKFLLWIFTSFLKRTRGFDIKNADTIKQLKKSNTPVLFIHGGDDDFVPTEMVYRLSEAVPELRREVYIVNGAGHIMSLPADEKSYTKRVNKFLAKYDM